MKIKEAAINPRLASQLLSANEGNRKIRPGVVTKYAAMMRAGRWMENGDVIRVARNGRLLDGQHRLHAVVESGATIRCGLVTDLDDATFTTIDTGERKGAHDFVRMTGRTNANTCAALAASLWRMIHGAQAFVSCPPDYVLTVLDRWPEIDEAAHRQAGSNVARTLATPVSAAFAWLYLAHIAGKPALAEHFMTGLNVGEGLVAGDPVLALRNRLISLRGSALIRASTRAVWGGVIRTIDALEAGETIKTVKLFKGDGGPVDTPALFFDHLRGVEPARLLKDIPAFNPNDGTRRFDTKLAAE